MSRTTQSKRAFETQISLDSHTMSQNYPAKCEIPNVDMFCGKVHLIINSSKGEQKVSVYLKLLGACPKHYAVLYRDEECKFRYGQFNYARCLLNRVKESTRFHVYDSNRNAGLLFETDTLKDTEKWIRALRCNMQCPYSPHVRRTSMAQED